MKNLIAAVLLVHTVASILPVKVLGAATNTHHAAVGDTTAVASLSKLFGVEDSECEETSSSLYDYIIVGGGLAGCVLAERLSTMTDKRILVLEAGRPDYKNLNIRIPAGILRLFRTKYDWQYMTAGERACQGRNIYLQRGKVLGGSSSTNACLYHRGSAMDYDLWNIPGWSSADVLPCFKAMENDDTGTGTPEFHGTGGEWNMDHVRYQNPLSQRFLEVASAAGLAMNLDFNDWSQPQDGAGRFHVSEKNGERCSGATAFLEKAIRRPNLTVLAEATVRRIQFDKATKTATAVEYQLGQDDDIMGTTVQAQLKPGGEVLVTAGAIGSPQILMCSGIGPARDLRALGIPIVHDNPNVGDNLQDHPAAVVSFQTPVQGVSVTSKLRWFGGITNPMPLLEWLWKRKGLLTSVGCDHGAFVRVTSSGTVQPDLQLRFIAAKALGPDGMTTYTKFRSMRAAVADGYTIQTIAIRAKSKGRVRLASSHTGVKPMIDLGYLSSSDDVATLREGIKLARILARRPEWGEYSGQEVYPGPEIQTDEQIEEYIRSTVHSSNALTGTCKMGIGADAVVGPDLKVLGVKGVRVADSSVIPIIPGGQTATPTVMIAERAAFAILNEQLSSSLSPPPPPPELSTSSSVDTTAPMTTKTQEENVVPQQTSPPPPPPELSTAEEQPTMA